MEKVSIIIPCYNRQELLERAVKSCLEQDYPNLEVIVVDDGSTDETEDLLRKLARQDNRVVWMWQENAGQCAARNAGFKKATGSYIKFLDSDDQLAPGAIAAQVNALVKSGAEFVVGGFIGHDEDKFEEALARFKEKGTTDSLGPMPLRFYIMNHTGTLNEALMRRELVEEAGGFNENLKAAEEINFLWRIYMRWPDLRIIQQERCVLFKRYSSSSLAAQMRAQKKTPWGLVSLMDVVEQVNKQPKHVDDQMRRELFDKFYTSAVYAYRDGQRSFAMKAHKLWKAGRFKSAKLAPWYHDLLHRTAGFKVAEALLGMARNVRAKRSP